MLKNLLKKTFENLGISPKPLYEKMASWSLGHAIKENGTKKMLERLRMIEPDISSQEEREKEHFNEYIELKRRALQAFQCSLMLEAIKGCPKGQLTVVDIGDSAGTHLSYLKDLTGGRFDINGMAVNLDKRAIEKIRSRGFEALHCRAEELNLERCHPYLIISFEMLEHLHNPALFLYRLAKRSHSAKLVVTVPYLRSSRVGLHHLRSTRDETIFAEDEHIFELSPKDWALLMLHGGWRIIYSDVYYQYPIRWPVVSWLLSLCWKAMDFEGFWGAILEPDAKAADRYQDWER